MRSEISNRNEQIFDSIRSDYFGHFTIFTSLKSYLFDYHCLYCINMFVDDLIIYVNFNSLNKILASLSRVYYTPRIEHFLIY